MDLARYHSELNSCEWNSIVNPPLRSRVGLDPLVPVHLPRLLLHKLLLAFPHHVVPADLVFGYTVGAQLQDSGQPESRLDRHLSRLQTPPMDSDTRVRLARAGYYRKQTLSQRLASWPLAAKEALRYYTYHNPSYVLSYFFGLAVPVVAGTAYYLFSSDVDWNQRPKNMVPLSYPFPSGPRTYPKGYED